MAAERVHRTWDVDQPVILCKSTLTLAPTRNSVVSRRLSAANGCPWSPFSPDSGRDSGRDSRGPLSKGQPGPTLNLGWFSIWQTSGLGCWIVSTSYLAFSSINRCSTTALAVLLYSLIPLPSHTLLPSCHPYKDTANMAWNTELTRRLGIRSKYEPGSARRELKPIANDCVSPGHPGRYDGMYSRTCLPLFALRASLLRMKRHLPCDRIPTAW